MGVLGFFNGLKRLIAPTEEAKNENYNTEKDKVPYFDIYEGLRNVYPLAIFDYNQLASFISNLAKNSWLNDSEKKAFHLLWNVACMDIDGFGHNIPFLKEGCYEIFNQDGNKVRFQKRQSSVKDYYLEEGRADFVYLSEDGGFVVRQNERNSKVFLIYVSENISDRLLNAVREAEARALYLNPAYAPTRRLGTEDSSQSFNIYEGLNKVNPYAIFVANPEISQLSCFLGHLAENENKLLKDSEVEALSMMWNLLCMDIDGFGHNVPFLKEGSYEFFNQDGISARFQKRQSSVKDDYVEGGIADFVYISEDGDFAIRQNENNSNTFLVYVSEDTSDRLLQAFGEAEADALKLNPDCIQTRERLGIPEALTQEIARAKTGKRSFQDQYRINAQESSTNYLPGKATEGEKDNKDEMDTRNGEER